MKFIEAIGALRKVVMRIPRGPGEPSTQTTKKGPMKSDASLVIDLGPRAQNSSRAILWIRAGMEIKDSSEVICTVRPREPFRPERLAVLASCAEAFDIVDLKIAHCSVFACDGSSTPAIRYAATYELRHQSDDPWMASLHRAVVSDEARLGQLINSRVCPREHDVAIIARHCSDAPPADLEVIILGTVLSEAEGYQTYLREQQELEQAWRHAPLP